MNRKWLILFLVLMFLAGWRLCDVQSETARARQPALVGFINLEDNRVFSGRIQSAFQKLADNTTDIQVKYYNGFNDAQIQNQSIHELIQHGAKAIILIAADPTDVFPGIQEANDAGIPVISLNTRSFGGTSTYVGVSDYDAGWMQGKYMREHLAVHAKLVYLAGPSNTISAQQRMQGFIDACLLQRADLKIVAAAESPYHQRNKAGDIMAQWLRQGLHPDAVAATNDEIAIGAWKALHEANSAKGVLISGIDASEEACQLIAEGELAQTVQQDAVGEAQGAYDALLQIIHEGNQHPDDIIVPVISITNENVQKIANEDG